MRSRGQNTEKLEESEPLEEEARTTAHVVFRRPVVTVSGLCLVFFVIATIVAVLDLRKAYHNETSNDWVILGALTSTSIAFRIRIPAGETTRLTVTTTTKDQVAVVWEAEFKAPPEDDWFVQAAYLETLEPRTRYSYRTSRSGKQMMSGSFSTPADEAFEFSFVTAGCSVTNSNSKVFDRIRTKDPLFLVHLGDFHYQDIMSSDPTLRIKAIDTVMGSFRQRNLWANTPLAYSWDDHDWMGNNSDENEKEPGARDSALRSYQWLFPHYPLVTLEQNQSVANHFNEINPVPIYHAFTIGSVRFVLTDLRSESNSERMFTDAQREWLYDQLRLADQYDFLVLINSKPWIGETELGEDNWMGVPDERLQLSNLLSSLKARNVLAVSSDAHMVGFDNGRNTYYGDQAVDGDIFSFPILQSGPLDRSGSTKGGPFSDGCHTTKFERNNQYSIISFESARDLNPPCLRIQSLSGEDTVLDKRLCGEIYSQIPIDGSKQGSCDAQVLSKPSLALTSTNVVITASVGGLLLWRFPSRKSFVFAALAWLGLLATYAIGIGIPLSGGYPLSLVETSIIAMVQTFCISTLLIYLAFKDRTKT